MIVKHNQRYSKQLIRGYGLSSHDIIGNGLLTDSIKTLGKYSLIGMKKLWSNIIKPRMGIIKNEGIKLGKELYSENKDKMAKIISEESKKVLKRIVSKGKSSNRVNDQLSHYESLVKNLINDNASKVSRRSKETLDKLLYGEGLKKLT